MKGGAGVLVRIVRGQSNPLDLLPSLLEAMPAASKLPLLELLELVNGAGLVGPANPPAWAAGLFDQVSEDAGLSHDLLAALSCVLADYSPDAEHFGRSGILGTPRTLFPNAAVGLDDLVLRDRAALNRIRLGAMVSARWIAGKRTEIGLTPALRAYVELGGAPLPYAVLDDVIWAYVVLLARRSRGEKLDALQEATHGR